MPTSGTVSFNPDILDLIEDAYEMVGMELRGGYDLKTARRNSQCGQEGHRVRLCVESVDHSRRSAPMAAHALGARGAAAD